MIDSIKSRILAARGKIPSRLVLKRARVVNLFSAEVIEGDIAVHDGFIAGIGSGYHGEKEIDLKGKWVVPGLIDGHIHIESSMLIPSRLAEALLIHGTTTIVSDPHEIANVMGLEGISFMLQESEGLPFDVFFMAPSCVPATPLETPGFEMGTRELQTLIGEPRVLGLAEMMNYPGVLAGDGEVLGKITLFRDRIIDGHAPSLSGPDLQAYLAAGIRSDHECSEASEALEKLRGGMMVMIREGTSARNFDALASLVNPMNQQFFCLVADDLHAEDIHSRGHLDFIIRKGIQSGMDPLTTVRLATLNPATYFGLKDRGAIAPGRKADMVVVENLETFNIHSVFKNGAEVVREGRLVGAPFKRNRPALKFQNSIRLGDLDSDRFLIRHPGGKARVIGVIPGQIKTVTEYHTMASERGVVRSDVDRDLLKLCVVERHHGSGRVGIGLVRGFGLKRGALASSVAHDSHHIIAVGSSDREILRAVSGIQEMGGGLIAVSEGRIIGRVPLEIAGLMTKDPLEELVGKIQDLKQAANSLGCPLEEPFMTLSFLALPVIPELKLTDRGLVDVNRFEHVPLFMASTKEGAGP